MSGGSVRPRALLEWALRAAALALLAWALVAALRPAAVVGRARVALVPESAVRTLAAWSREPALGVAEVALGAAPSPLVRDWLRALNGAGTTVRWTGGVPALALSREPVADPRGGTRVRVAATGGPVVLHDAVGVVDTVAPRARGATVRVASLVGALDAMVDGTAARARAVAAAPVRTVVVLGSAGWEGKFLAAALEESGYQVALRLAVAPGIAVRQGALVLDTARTAAVVALDSTAAGDAAAIAAFVRTGGGAVLAGTAARAPAFAALRAGAPGALVRGTNSFAAAAAPVRRETLDHLPVTSMRGDAVALEVRAGQPVVAARRVDAGRVVQTGLLETWRWRMAGDEQGPDAHRAWWAQVVSSVAHLPTPQALTAEADPAAHDRAAHDPAPRAALVAALGEPATAPAPSAPRAPFDPSRQPLVYIAVAMLLVAEWASRRLRGAP